MIGGGERKRCRVVELQVDQLEKRAKSEMMEWGGRSSLCCWIMGNL